MGHSEGIHANAVDTLLFNRVGVVEEHILDALWFLGNGRKSCDDPAVAYASLKNVFGGDTISAEK